MQAWLIEYVGAKPSPTYAPEDFTSTHGCYTLDAWAAKRFETKAEAEDWMTNPNGMQPYHKPWAAVQHEFDVRCSECGEETGTWYEICKGCIPF